jgi:hypothetical protein
MRTIIELIFALRLPRRFSRGRLLTDYLRHFNRKKIYMEHDDRFKH